MSNYELRACPPVDIVKEFFSRNTFKNFRYFSSRSYDVLQNHYVYYGLFTNNEMVGYGHLDPDQKSSGMNWVGLCLSDIHRGKGLGDLILKTLLSFAKSNNIEDVYLSVDRSNHIAMKLYTKNNFEIDPEFNEVINDVIIMKHKGE